MKADRPGSPATGMVVQPSLMPVPGGGTLGFAGSLQ
jgi:hypothetical protein